MPKEFDDCVQSIIKSGKDEDTAYAICTSQFVKKYGKSPAEMDEDKRMSETKDNIQADYIKFSTISDSVFLSEDESKTVDVQVLRRGKFKHPVHGTLEFNDKKFDTFIKNFNDRVYQENIAYDFNHKPDLGAAAWVKNLYKKDDGLWAKIEPTQKGFNSLKEKEFLYFSTEYTDEYEDKETGKKYGPVIMGGGLTNRPFIKGMAPILLSEGNNECIFTEEVENSLTEIIETKVKLKENNLKTNYQEGVFNMDKNNETYDIQLSEIKDMVLKLSEKGDAIDIKELSDSISAIEKVVELTKEQVENKDKEIKELSDQNKKIIDQNKELDIITKQLMEDRDKAREIAYQKDVEFFCKELSEKGHYPAVIDVAKEILLADKGSKEVVKLTEDGKEISLSIKDIMKKLFNAMPDEAKIDMSEKSVSPESKSINGTKELSSKDIERIASENGVSYRDALVKLSHEGKLIL